MAAEGKKTRLLARYFCQKKAMKTILIMLAVTLSGTVPAELPNKKPTHQSSSNQSTSQPMETQSMQVVRDFLTAVQQGN